MSEHRFDQHAHLFENRTRIEVLAAKRARTEPRQDSWWTKCAQPDQRSAFMVAAAQRHERREAKRHALTLKVDAQ